MPASHFKPLLKDLSSSISLSLSLSLSSLLRKKLINQTSEIKREKQAKPSPMKGRVGFNGGAPPADLLVCFPSRAHLTLMPKPIYSPSRHSPRPALFRPTTTKPGSSNHRRHRTGSNSKAHPGSDIGSEPTSPKVTCAGQIKVRHHRRNRDGPKSWLDALGLKKDVMNFLGALRGLRFNMHCFGNFHGAVDCCSDDNDEELEEDDEDEEASGSHHASGTAFSKWFTVLEENQDRQEEEEEGGDDEEEEKQEEEEEVKLPPKNALLLMRCRSAPAKERREKEEEDVKGEEERMMLMSYAPDFFKVMSTEIAKETWVVGSVDPSMARSRSWRR